MKVLKTLFTLVFVLSITGQAIAQEAPKEEKKEEGIAWYTLEEAQKLAKENGKKVLIFGQASWCPYCRQMEREVYPQPEVVEIINKYFYTVMIDTESQEKLKFNEDVFTEQEFAAALRLYSLPTHYFVTSDGQVIAGQPGALPDDIFERLLAFVGSDSYTDTKFEDYIYKGTKLPLEATEGGKSSSNQ